jgi:hypothetical protein
VALGDVERGVSIENKKAMSMFLHVFHGNIKKTTMFFLLTLKKNLNIK